MCSDHVQKPSKPKIVVSANFVDVPRIMECPLVAAVVVEKPAVRSWLPIEKFFTSQKWETRVCPRGQPATGENYKKRWIHGSDFATTRPKKMLRNNLSAWFPKELMQTLQFQGKKNTHQWVALWTDEGFETPFHMDVSGVCPMMCIKKGKKRWTLALPTIENVHQLYKERDDLLHDTVSVVLEPGQTLILRPGCLHTVTTEMDTFGVAGVMFLPNLISQHASFSLIESRTLFGFTTYYDLAVARANPKLVQRATKPSRKRKGQSAQGQESKATATTSVDVQQELDENFIKYFVKFAGDRMQPFLSRLGNLAKTLESVVGSDTVLSQRFEADYLQSISGWKRIDLPVKDRCEVYLCMQAAQGMLDITWNGGKTRKRVLADGKPRRVELPKNWTAATFYAALVAVHAYEKHNLVNRLHEDIGLGKAFSLALLGTGISGQTKIAASRLSLVTPLSDPVTCGHEPVADTLRGVRCDLYKCGTKGCYRYVPF